ncbi:probable ATP-dependent RNA helicase Dbp73D [Chrysoperla carnea]|uniref:probable ATP-dependent RNA helicase Dbp73D n=1 Tax=Chrysoperla carnea TaxID=189513 RepID=UPI001D079CE0|nr:probable ATP-dependent RNA helicase Dbp73D [Chrysoperla carnea]
MSLFQIRRYVGDDTIVSSTDKVPKEVAEKNLERLLKKTEKRKRNREKIKFKKAFPLSKKHKTEVINEHERLPEVPQQKEEIEIVLPKENDIEKPQTEFSFQVIGNDKLNKIKEVKRVLPHWLTHPVQVDGNLKELKVKIEDVMYVEKQFQDLLRESGVTHYFPVQSAVIPYFLQEINKPYPYWPRDICISAATGSGKTLAFVIPVIQALKYQVVRKIRAVVVLPVKELASQVFEVFRKFAKLTKVRVTLCTGRIPFEAEQKTIIRKIDDQEYIHLSDIIVTTPGRLVDHIHMTPGFTLKHLKFLILDEADRMIDREQNDWIYHLEQHMRKEEANFRVGKINLQTFQNTNPPPQKILASATLTQDPEKLYQIGLFKPKLFTSNTANGQIELENVKNDDIVGKLAMPQELNHKYLICSIEMKPQVLFYLITKFKMTKALCFTGSGLEAHRLTLLLRHMSNNQFIVEELSSIMSPNSRKITLTNFSTGKINILVSTDALARGLDIPDVDYVISYNAPKHIETYVHRVGRTGRAGKTGTAITLVNTKQKSYFLKLFTNQVNLEDITVEDEIIQNETPTEVYQKALEQTKLDLDNEKQLMADKNQRLKNVKKKRKIKKKQPTT